MKNGIDVVNDERSKQQQLKKTELAIASQQ